MRAYRALAIVAWCAAAQLARAQCPDFMPAAPGQLDAGSELAKRQAKFGAEEATSPETCAAFCLRYKTAECRAYSFRPGICILGSGVPGALLADTAASRRFSTYRRYVRGLYSSDFAQPVPGKVTPSFVIEGVTVAGTCAAACAAEPRCRAYATKGTDDCTLSHGDASNAATNSNPNHAKYSFYDRREQCRCKPDVPPVCQTMARDECVRPLIPILCPSLCGTCVADTVAPTAVAATTAAATIRTTTTTTTTTTATITTTTTTTTTTRPATVGRSTPGCDNVYGTPPSCACVSLPPPPPSPALDPSCICQLATQWILASRTPGPVSHAYAGGRSSVHPLSPSRARRRRRSPGQSNHRRV